MVLLVFFLFKKSVIVIKNLVQKHLTRHLKCVVGASITHLSPSELGKLVS